MPTPIYDEQNSPRCTSIDAADAPPRLARAMCRGGSAGLLKARARQVGECRVKHNPDRRRRWLSPARGRYLSWWRRPGGAQFSGMGVACPTGD